MAEEAVAAPVVTRSLEEHIAGLNEAQRLVVVHGDDPLLVLAAAGTGKTETLTTRIAYMIKVRGIPHGEILAVTFTNKAAKEMRTRASRLAGVSENDLTIGTFHGICARILRAHPAYAAFAIMDNADSVRQVGLCCKALNVDTRLHKPDVIFARMNSWRNDGLSPQDVMVGASPFDRIALDVYVMYRGVCAKNSVVDFSDLIMHVVHLFRTDHAFRDRFRARWRHILVDEYQDTNPVQLEWIRHLCSTHGSIMVVGDDCQAIHEWRGARVKNILDFPAQFAGTTVLKLEKNYRSVSNVLTAANNVIKNNVMRTDKMLVCTKAAGRPLEVYRYRGEHEESRGTAKIIKAAVAAGECAYSDVCVLYRVNRMSQNFEKVFREQSIPYRIVGTLSFFERLEVKDVLAYVRLASNPASDIDFRRAVNAPCRGVGIVALEKLSDLGDGASLFQSAIRHHGKLRGKAGDGVREFMGIFGVRLTKPPTGRKKPADAPQAAPAPPPDDLDALNVYHGVCDALDAVKKIVRDSGYMSHLSDNDEHDRIENVKQLLALVRKGAEELGPCTLQDLLSSLMLAEVGAEQTADTNVVTMMSMHASKGLEFGTVFLVGMGDGTMPFAKAVGEGRMEEERRLMYVAITRAKERLLMSYPAERYTYAGPQRQGPSMFLDEIGPVPTKMFGQAPPRPAADANGASGSMRHRVAPPTQPRAVSVTPSTEEVACGVCMVNHPDCVLDCGNHHVFCEDCVVTLRQRGTYTCPQCRQDYSLRKSYVRQI